jgi:hypothetical protein
MVGAHAMTIRADLIGSQCATALGITATGPAPVLRLCRALISTGHDPATRLEAYRGETLCLVIRSIGEAATLTVKSTSAGQITFAPDSATAPCIRENELAATSGHETEISERASLLHGEAA